METVKNKGAKITSGTITLIASGNPTGGTFSWSTTSGKITLTTLNNTRVRVTSVAASGSPNDIPITVTYTVNNQTSDPFTFNIITVVKPTSLQLISDTTDPDGHICDPSAPNNQCDKSKFSGNGSYTSYRKDRTYRILDQFGIWMQAWGLEIVELFSPSVVPVTVAPPGDTIPDCFYFCSETCRTGGSESLSATQTIKANGFVVATKSVTWTCTGATVQ